MKKGMLMVLAAVALFMVIGVLVLLASGTVRIGDIFRVLSNAGPRIIGFIALPFIVVAVVIGWLYARKREERLWKHAMSQTRAARRGNEKDS